MQVLIVVTHLLGTGHLRRAINLSQAFAASGHAVALVSGGFPVEVFDTTGVSFIQLPPLRSDGTNFARLLTADNIVATESYLQAREFKITELAESLRPDIIITELFPFGRRILRREFLSLLEWASLQQKQKAPLVMSSVRDILAAPSSDQKVQQTESLIASHYDGVLVHSDVSVTPLSASWPVSDQLERMLYYTGYVTQSDSVYPVNGDAAEVVVSAGGGLVGRHIYECAAAAAPLSPQWHWRLLVGGKGSQAEIKRLTSLAAAANLVVEPIQPNFRRLLSSALCSVSMCGYNTAIDLLITGTPGVLVPFDAGGELEQTIRATRLSERSSFVLLLAKNLTPASLSHAVEQASTAGRRDTVNQGFNGALESVRIATRLARNKRSSKRLES